ncbi:IS3 family transposase [Nostocoides jenkinsii]|uniref:IS3 family transposase n=1 Tax=Nostocoides jenkinsii TaxID=330834 RepID=UPI0012ECD3BD|nr:IS3 family transposase [Tetrasphaera jenkinsii]
MGTKSTSGKPTTRRYSPEEKARAVRLVRQLRKELGTTHGTVQRVADQIGCGVESLRTWVKQADIDEGVELGLTTVEAKRIKELEQENRELRRANDLLKRASGFLRGGARPPLEVIVAFVDENRAEFGVEFICRHLQVAPSSYYAAKKRQIAPSARAVRDLVMMQVLMTLWVANRKVYGAHKLWKAAQRAGHDIGRDQVARLMRGLGIEGVSRLRKKVFTTKQDPGATRAPDLVNRHFKADRPDALWVTDLTYVPTRSGMAYVCFIVDAFSRRIVGWRVAANMKTEMVLDALEMARASRGGHRLIGLVTHSDAGSQFTSVRFTERLEEIGARPSIGTVADSYDNALAETANGLYKTECVYGPDTTGWDDVDELELATLSWVHWFNETRLHGHCDDIPPAEYEAAFYAAQEADPG